VFSTAESLAACLTALITVLTLVLVERFRMFLFLFCFARLISDLWFANAQTPFSWFLSEAYRQTQSVNSFFKAILTAYFYSKLFEKSRNLIQHRRP